jgi:hypothetical protein
MSIEQDVTPFTFESDGVCASRTLILSNDSNSRVIARTSHSALRTLRLLPFYTQHSTVGGMVDQRLLRRVSGWILSETCAYTHTHAVTILATEHAAQQHWQQQQQ